MAEGTAGAVGEEFLRCLAQHVAEAFAAKMVLIGEADDPSGMHVRTLVSWYDGAFIEEPFSYDTAGTPCAVMTDYPWVAFPEALSERFPNAEIAINLGLQSYLAVCLRSSDNVHLGHLAVLDTRPMEAGEEDAAALRIFAARASAELERRNQANALAASRERVIEAADNERRRVGRDLHDGAQQRLLAVSNLLRVSRMQLDEATPRTTCWRAPRRSSRRRTRSCASWPAACTRSRFASAGSARRWRRCARPRRPDRGRRLRGRAAAADRARRRLRGGGVARQRRPLRAGEQGRGADREQGRRWWSKSATTASAAPTSRRAPGCPASSDRVDVLRGCLEVESPAGGGTRVHATIPLRGAA